MENPVNSGIVVFFCLGHGPTIVVSFLGATDWDRLMRSVKTLGSTLPPWSSLGWSGFFKEKEQMREDLELLCLQMASCHLCVWDP